MTQEEFDKAPKIEQVLYDCTGMLAKNHPDIIEAMTIYADSEVKKLNLHDVSGSLLCILDCVKSGGLTRDKTYKILHKYKDSYCIIDDNDELETYNYIFFKEISSF